MTLRRLVLRWLLLLGAALNLWANGGPPGARVTEILAFPSSSNLLYGATDAGVFRGDNLGLSRPARNEDLTNLSVQSLAAAPQFCLPEQTLAPFARLTAGPAWQAINQGLGEVRVLSLAMLI